MTVSAIKKNEQTLLPTVPKASKAQRERYQELNRQLASNNELRGALQNRLNELRKLSQQASEVRLREIEGLIEVLVIRKECGSEDAARELEAAKTELKILYEANEAQLKMKSIQNEIVSTQQEASRLNSEKKLIEAALQKSVIADVDLAGAVRDISLHLMTTGSGTLDQGVLMALFDQQEYACQRAELNQKAQEALR